MGAPVETLFNPDLYKLSEEELEDCCTDPECEFGCGKYNTPYWVAYEEENEADDELRDKTVDSYEFSRLEMDALEASIVNAEQFWKKVRQSINGSIGSLSVDGSPSAYDLEYVEVMIKHQKQLRKMFASRRRETIGGADI